MKPKAIRFVRDDGQIFVCVYCPDYDSAKIKFNLDSEEKQITKGVCPDCIKRFKLDSLVGTSLALGI